MQITAEYQNDTNISQATTSSETISVSINATQDDGSGGFTPTPAEQKVYAINIDGIHKNTSTLTDIGMTYNSCSATGKDTCLRYTIENNIVTGAEACFVKGGVEYCLTGWIDESQLQEKPIYNTNKTTLQTAFTEANACSEYDNTNFYCSASSFGADADSVGSVYAYGGGWECGISSVDSGAGCGNT